jgi:lipopolysaccharide export system permease protein
VAVDASRPRRSLRPKLIDLYLLRTVISPGLLCLGVILLVMLLERGLRLVNELVARGAHLEFIVPLVGYLTPYYLGLALPAAFAVGLVVAFGQLNDDSEIEVMLAAGLRLDRLVAPLFLLGVVLGAINLGVFGFAEPYARHAYRTTKDAAADAGWAASLQSGAFQSQGERFIIGADRAAGGGRRLKGVFVAIRDAGTETVITADQGLITPAPPGGSSSLSLDRGVILRDAGAGSARVVRFQNYVVASPFPPRPKARARGADERELTLVELVQRLSGPPGRIARNALAADLYARIARSVTLPLLPLLAIPFAMATKRGRRSPGLLLVGGLLLAWHHALMFARSAAANGQVDPALAIGGVMAVFTALSVWLYLGSRARPGDSPVTAFLARLQVAPTRPPARPKPAPRRRAAGFSRYVATLFAMRTLAAAAVLVGLLQMVELLDRMDDILGRGLGLEGVVRYAVLRLPAMVQQVAPLSVLVGALFGFSALARRSETTAMRAAGVSSYQVFAMALPVAIAIAAAVALIGDQVTPRAQAELVRWWEASSPGPAKAAPPRWYRIGSDVVVARDASRDGRRLVDVRIYRRGKDRILGERIAAAYADAGAQGWRLTDATITDVGFDAAVSRHFGRAAWRTTLDPRDVARLSGDTLQTSVATAWKSLDGRIATTQSRGFFLTRIFRAVGEPLAPVVMLLLALPVLWTGGRVGSPMAPVIVLGAGLLYVVADGLLTALGQTGLAPAPLGALGAPLLFALVGTAIVFRKEG